MNRTFYFSMTILLVIGSAFAQPELKRIVGYYTSWSIYGRGYHCSAPVEFGILGSYFKTLTTGEKRCQESANISLPKKRSLF